MFEEKEEVTIAVDSLFAKAINDYSRGDIIAWQTVQNIIGIKYDSNEGRHIIKRFRDKLLKGKGIATRCKTSAGIILLTNQEQVRVCSEDRQRRAHRQCNRCLREVESADVMSLNQTDRLLLAHTKYTVTQARKQCRKGVKNAMNAGRATEVNPVRKVKEMV